MTQEKMVIGDKLIAAVVFSVVGIFCLAIAAVGLWVGAMFLRAAMMFGDVLREIISAAAGMVSW